MRSLRVLSIAVLLVCSLFAPGVFAVIEDNAPIVKIRESCTEAGVALDNCFEGLNLFAEWFRTTRQPTASSPLLVDIGPGNFGSMELKCGGTRGYTTFRGAGMGQTVIGNMTFRGSCVDLDFSDLIVRVVGEGAYGGILWNGGGTSTWHNVTVEGIGQSWYSETCDSVRGSHYWFNSRIINTAAFALANSYRETCDESWFFGSEITTIVPVGIGPVGGAAVAALDRGIIHVYGSVLRAIVDGPTSQVGVAAVISSGGTSSSEVHIHGTGIDVISNTGANIVALSAGTNGEIHANQSSYNLKTTGGRIRIANNGGHVHAPYLWEEHTTPPNITSQDGADIAVVTTPGGTPKMVIYSTACASKWFDVGANACRP